MKGSNHVMLAFLTAVMTLQIPFVTSTFSSPERRSYYRTNDSANVGEARTSRRSSYETKNPNGQEARIVGGHDVNKGRYPYMVSLQSTSEHGCGAVLVAPDVILTAAHCLYDFVVVAVIGRFDLENVDEEDSQIIDIMYYLKHPDNVFETDEYDIGLVKLTESTNLPPITLNRNSALLEEGMVLTVMGYGDLGNGSYPTVLQEVEVNYIPNDDCLIYQDPLGEGLSYRNFIFDDMMCALGENKDGCFGDSGGPLIWKGDDHEQDVVVGIVSWGIGCARLPGVYARVDYMYDWISTTICELSQDAPDYLQCLQTSGTEPAQTPAPTVTLPDDLGKLNYDAKSGVTRLFLWGACLLLQLSTMILAL
jgi:trypsin